MRRRCTSQAIVPARQDATQPQANVPCARHTPHARTWTSDVARWDQTLHASYLGSTSDAHHPVYPTDRRPPTAPNDTTLDERNST